jgi:hypothetical protein
MKTFIDNSIIYIDGKNSKTWLLELAKFFILEQELQVVMLNVNNVSFFDYNVKILNFTTLNHIYNLKHTIVKEETVILINNFSKYKNQKDSVAILHNLPKLFKTVIYTNDVYITGYKVYANDDNLIDNETMYHKDTLSKIIKLSSFL